MTGADACSTATSGRGTGMVGYNVQVTVDTQHHLIVAHEVTNVGHDRDALVSIAEQARDATGEAELIAVADKGSTHFLTRALPKVSTEMSLNVLAYNLKRMMNIFGVTTRIGAIAT